MDALTKARVDADRMYASATAAVHKASGSGAGINALFGPEDGLQARPQAVNATEEYLHFRGWVYAAIRAIAQRIAGQTINVGRRTRRRMPGTKAHQLKQLLPRCYKAIGDKLEPLEDHPLLELFEDPNGLMVGSSLIFSLVANLELTGQQLWHLPNQPRTTILPIPSDWIMRWEGTTSVERWILRSPWMGGEMPVYPQDCAYFHYPHPKDPRLIYSPLQAAAHATFTDEALQACQLTMFRKGILPKTVLRVGRLKDGSTGEGQRPVLTPAQRRQLVTAVRAAYGGSERWEEPLILDGLIEGIDSMGRTVKEMDFLKSGAETKARIYQAFGVNPIVTGEVEDSNRASATVADEIFIAATVNPKIALLSQCLTAWLGPMFAEPGEKLVVWIDECHPHDPDLVTQQWNFGLSKGVVTPNEWRRKILNMADMAGGDEPLPPSAPPAPATPAAVPAGDKNFNPYTLKPFANGKAHKHRSRNAG